jgi:methionyl aminopeptidase
VKAGKTVKEVRDSIHSFICKGESFLNICERVEEEIEKRGCKPAFPCNIGVNEIAAHYTASHNDNRTVPSNSVIKIDLGAHVNGYIADTATTVVRNSEYESMFVAAEEALDRAVKRISLGTKINDISRVIERTIESYGYKPISNLCGHKTTKYIVHSSPSIPNKSSLFSHGKLEPNNVYAVEPFVTTKDAAGIVVDGPPGNIYHLSKLKRPKNKKTRNLLASLHNKYRTLPFTTRWFFKESNTNDTKENFKILEREKRIESYPVFFEKTSKPVVQAEHSLLLTEKDVIKLT